MPWEKSFDIDEVTDRAIDVFWEKGYEGASMADLIAGMGINKGSLYNAFGSKRALFDRAFLRYDRLNRQTILRNLEALNDPVRAIEELFDGIIAEAVANNDMKGCLLVNTAIDLPNRDDAIKKAVTASMAEIEAFFDRMIRLGQTEGVIPRDIKPEETAQSLLSMVLGVRVLARGAADGRSLNGIKAGAMQLIR